MSNTFGSASASARLIVIGKFAKIEFVDVNLTRSSKTKIKLVDVNLSRSSKIKLVDENINEIF